MGTNWPEHIKKHFLYDVYEHRLGWVKKKIPISYIDPVSKLRLEGYISTPPNKTVTHSYTTVGGKGKPKVVKEKYYSDDVVLTVYPAFLPIFSPNVVYIRAENILPTMRKYTIFDYESYSHKEVAPIPASEDYKYPSRTKKELLDVYKYYPDLTWTVSELLSMSNDPHHAIDLIEDGTLVEAGKRHCLITSNMETTYKPETPVSDHTICSMK